MKLPSIILAIVAVLAVVASFWSGYDIARKRYQSLQERPDTIYKIKWVPAPVPDPEVTPVLPKLVYLPVREPVPYAVHDTLYKTDSVLVEVPIVEKQYIGDDYRATIRGFQPELVNIWIRGQEKIVKVPYQKHWSFTVGPQIGFGFTPQGWQPYAGGGVTFGYSF